MKRLKANNEGCVNVAEAGCRACSPRESSSFVAFQGHVKVRQAGLRGPAAIRELLFLAWLGGYAAQPREEKGSWRAKPSTPPDVDMVLVAFAIFAPRSN